MPVLVKHWRHGKIVVDATCRTEAICRAAIAWGVRFTDIEEGAQCYVRRKEGTRNETERA